MTREEACSQKNEAISSFQFEGLLIEEKPYGSGHINDTFRLIYKQENGSVRRYILQRMNKEIFKNPEELMENIIGVTSYLREKILAQGGDALRETLNVIPTVNGGNFFIDSNGQYWRAYYFIEHAVSYDAVERPEDFYQSGFAFGNFQRLLSDYPAAKLHETIKDFHNTPDRFKKFKQAVEADICGRVKDVEGEIRFVMERERDVYILQDMLEKGELPLRVTHNDTKLNNVMLDKDTGKGVCVIDLDTVMPGLSVTDFGDAIRFGANTGLEDEQDLSKITCDLELYEQFTRGFMEGCGDSLTENEFKMLPVGAKMITLECGMRFLTDYLQGDQYYKIHREGHNVDRCRTQFKLLADMESKWEKMQEIVRIYAEQYTK